MRRFEGDKLVIATHNKGKLGEFQKLLGPFVRSIVSAGELGLGEPEETGTTFADNAILKARAAAKTSGLPALADDSGLCVRALDGNPGLHSARWCGPERVPMVGMSRIHAELADSADRSAFFISTLALCWPDGHVEVVEGQCDGQIVWPPRGTNGHGYDPIFLPDGHDKTFGEMEPADKDAISHRGRALQKLLALFGGA